METMKLKLNNGEEIEVVVTRRKMKSVRLKVFPNEEVAISAPHGVSLVWVERFLEKKRDWIEGKLGFFRESAANDKLNFIKSGVNIRLLGEQLMIIIREARQKRVILDDDKLYIYTPNPKDEKTLAEQLDSWIKIQQKELYESLLAKLYPVIGKYGYARPTIKVRKMKTLWGSCNRKKGIITLNYYLYKAKKPCIEYVMLHELIHIMYPGHNKEFYDFLSIHMPGWKERKKILDYEVVLGV